MESSVIVDVRQRTERRMKRESVQQALRSRFNEVPQDVLERVAQLEDLATLDRLHWEAIRCDRLEAVRRVLRELSEE